MTIGFGEPVELYRAASLPEAHAVCIALEAEGIAAQIDNDILQGALGDLPMGWSTAPRVLVNRSNVAAARAILEKVHRQTVKREDCGEGDDANPSCLACGVEMGQQTQCPACGWSYESASDTSLSGLADFPLSRDERTTSGPYCPQGSEATRLPPARANTGVTETAFSQRDEEDDEDEPAATTPVNLVALAVILVPCVLLLWLAWVVLR